MWTYLVLITSVLYRNQIAHMCIDFSVMCSVGRVQLFQSLCMRIHLKWLSVWFVSYVSPWFAINSSFSFASEKFVTADFLLLFLENQQMAPDWYEAFCWKRNTHNAIRGNMRAFAQNISTGLMDRKFYKK